MRAPFCRYLKVLNATHIRKVACVAGGTVMPRVRSWRRRPRGIWLVPNIYAAQPPKNYNSRPLIPPATQAIGKLHGKERSRSKDLRSNLGIYLETFLPCSLIGRNKEGFRHHQEPTRTSGRKKVCRIPRWDATCDYVLCRISCSPDKKLFQWNLFGHWGISIQWTTPFRRHKICRPGQMFTKSSFLVPLFTAHLPWSRGCLLNSWDRDTSSYNWR